MFGKSCHISHSCCRHSRRGKQARHSWHGRRSRRSRRSATAGAASQQAWRSRLGAAGLAQQAWHSRHGTQAILRFQSPKQDSAGRPQLTSSADLTGISNNHQSTPAAKASVMMAPEADQVKISIWPGVSTMMYSSWGSRFFSHSASTCRESASHTNRAGHAQELECNHVARSHR